MYLLYLRCSVVNSMHIISQRFWVLYHIRVISCVKPNIHDHNQPTYVRKVYIHAGTFLSTLLSTLMSTVNTFFVYTLYMHAGTFMSRLRGTFSIKQVSEEPVLRPPKINLVFVAGAT